MGLYAVRIGKLSSKLLDKVMAQICGNLLHNLNSLIKRHIDSFLLLRGHTPCPIASKGYSLPPRSWNKNWTILSMRESQTQRHDDTRPLSKCTRHHPAGSDAGIGGRDVPLLGDLLAGGRLSELAPEHEHLWQKRRKRVCNMASSCRARHQRLRLAQPIPHARVF